MLGAGHRLGPIFLVAFFGLIAAAQEPAAPPVDPQKAALIRQIMDASLTPELRHQMIDASLAPAAQILRLNPVFPRAFVDELESKLHQRFEALDFGQFLVPVYAREFSLEELEQIKEFQTSAVGRKLLARQPGMYREMSTAVAAWGKNAGTEAAQEIIAEHPEYVEQVRAGQKQNAGPKWGFQGVSGPGGEDRGWRQRADSGEQNGARVQR